jgi:hypothetical protein
MRPLCADDEFPHPPTGSSVAPWLDTWWFVCRDNDSDVIVEVHMTLSPTHGPGGRSAVLIRQGRREFTETYEGPAIITHGSHGTDRVTLTVIEPEWTDAKRLRIQGSVDAAHFDLRLAGRFDAADAARLAPGFLPSDASSGGEMRNAQQGMMFDGTVTIADETIAVSGSAMRDRSWGWRESNELLRQGWVAMLGHTADAVYSVVGFYPGDARDGRGGRYTAWFSTGDGVTVATAASLVYDSAGVPTRLRLSTEEGPVIDLTRAEHVGGTYLSFHDSDSAENALVIAMMNHHVLMADSAGNLGWGYANLGNPLMTHPFDGMTFFPSPDRKVRQ